MPRRKIIRRDAHGAYLDYARPDEDAVTNVRGALRDGERLRVPLYLMDADRRRRVIQRDPFGREQATYTEDPDEADEEREEARADAVTCSDGIYNDPLALMRPGYRLAPVDAAAQQRLADAYRDYDIAMMEQHKGPRDQNALAFSLANYETGAGAPGKGSGGPPGAYPYRAVLEGSQCTLNGQNGRLVREGNWLVCKPTRTDAASIQDATSQAYADYDLEMANAWKK